MSIAIIINNGRAEEWKEKISKAMPDTKVEVYPSISDFNAVNFILAWKPEKDFCKEFPNLKVVQSMGAGVDHLMGKNIPSNVQIARMIDVNLKQDMFEFVLNCILSVSKNFYTYVEQQNQKLWKEHNYLSIKDTTVTILGMGEIGGYVASNLVKLGFKVRGWSKHKKNIDNVETFAGEQDLSAAVKEVNFVVNILPLTDDTRGILNTNFFNLLSPKTNIINVGRGGHLVDEDLLEALKHNKINFAVLDVFNEEPLPENHPFWTNKKIKITPHIASMTNVNSTLDFIKKNYEFSLSNKPVLNLVDNKKGY